VAVSGTVSWDQTWEAFDLGDGVVVPYQVEGDVTVASGVTLTIEGGVVVKFRWASYDSDKRRMTVSGILELLGTSGNEVVFTSERDDTYGGDTNGDDTELSPTKGDWGYVRLVGETTGFEHAILRYGGRRTSSNYMLWVDGGSVDVTDCVFEQSYSWALYYEADGTTPTTSEIRGNVFTSCSQGIYFVGGALPVAGVAIAENVLTSGTTGIRLQSTDGNLTVSGNSISGYSATAVSCTTVSSVLTGNWIRANSGTDGAGISCTEGSPLIEYNVIDGNSASRYGGGIYCNGGSPNIRGNRIIGNYAYSYGGGVYCTSCSPIMTQNAISGNEVRQRGAGLYCYNSGVNLQDNVITGNTLLAAGQGGGACLDTSSGIVKNNVLAYNATANGGFGGGLYLLGSSPQTRNNTFTQNSAGSGGYGGAIYCDSGSSPTITASILWADVPDEIYGGNPVVSYSDVMGGWPADPTNINADPLFLEGFHLRQNPPEEDPTSPCVDSGDVTAEEAGLSEAWTRTDEVPDQGVVDMGYHYSPDAPRSLFVDRTSMPLSGGKARFSLWAGIENAGRLYVLFIGMSGTEPGTDLPGGQATLPLNFDILTRIGISLINTPIFWGFLGTLNDNGLASATFDTLGPLSDFLLDETLSFAFALGDPWDYASNPVSIQITAE
ncbi:MAG: right-handed parallel beta-helix repeat-containing protein, partial [Planctomycetota bacterium]